MLRSGAVREICDFDRLVIPPPCDFAVPVPTALGRPVRGLLASPGATCGLGPERARAWITVARRCPIMMVRSSPLVVNARNRASAIRRHRRQCREPRPSGGVSSPCRFRREFAAVDPWGEAEARPAPWRVGLNGSSRVVRVASVGRPSALTSPDVVHRRPATSVMRCVVACVAEDRRQPCIARCAAGISSSGSATTM